jgi:hypothetical protein
MRNYLWVAKSGSETSQKAFRYTTAKTGLNQPHSLVTSFIVFPSTAGTVSGWERTTGFIYWSSNFLTQTIKASIILSEIIIPLRVRDMISPFC